MGRKCCRLGGRLMRGNATEVTRFPARVASFRTYHPLIMQKRPCVLPVILVALWADGAHAQLAGDQRSAQGAVYRVVPAESDAVTPFLVKPVDAGEALPAKMVRLTVGEPTRFEDLVVRVLEGTGIQAVFVGDDALWRRRLSDVKFSGRIAGVLTTLSQAVGAQYSYRDNVVRFIPKRTFSVSFADAEEGRYLPSLVQKAGGVVVSTDDTRREILFSAEPAALSRIKGELAGLTALKRDPGRQAAARNLVLPVRPAGVVSTGQGGGMEAVVRVADGHATVRWDGDATDLVRQLAAAAGAIYGGTRGTPRPLRIQVSVSDKPLLTALEAIGVAMGNSADLVVSGNRYLVAFNSIQKRMP